eukprot:scaffold35927_cov48-Attheya_sp.AAC.1
MKQNRPHNAETEARSALADATAGVVGALVATLAFYPMDLYKTNLQANRNNSSRSRNHSPSSDDHDHDGEHPYQYMNKKPYPSDDASWLRTQCFENGTKGWKEWIHTIQRCRLLFRGWIQSRYHRLRSASASASASAPPSVAARLILSGLAAMMNTLLTLPLDVWSAQSQTITATTTTTTTTTTTDSTASTTETKPVIPTATLLKSKCEDDTTTTTNTMTTTESTTSPTRNNKHALVLMNDVWTQVNNHSNHTSNSNNNRVKNRNGLSPSSITSTASNHSSSSSSHYSPAYGTERGSILLSVMTSSDGYATPDEDEDDNDVIPLIDGNPSSFAFPSSPSLTALCWSGHQATQPISPVPLLNHDDGSTNDDAVAVSTDVSTTPTEPPPHWTDGWKGVPLATKITITITTHASESESTTTTTTSVVGIVWTGFGGQIGVHPADISPDSGQGPHDVSLVASE